MDDAATLSLTEFLADIRSMFICPAKRFALIHERRALWGSMALLLVPAYFGFTWAGGIYFDRDPFPGYSILIPAIIGTAVTLFKMYLIHLSARVFQWSRRGFASTGSFRELAVIFGYANVPNILALLISLILFLLIPEQLSSLFRNFRPVAISFFVAVGIALFIWHLILMVLALRLIYPLRDLKIVLSLILATALATILVPGIMRISAPVRVEYGYAQPIFNPRILQFYSADPEAAAGHEVRVDVHIDLIVYQFQSPKRFELIAFDGEASRSRTANSQAAGNHRSSSRTINHSKQIVGRIVGVPGDTVAFNKGHLQVNGQRWTEAYIAGEFDSSLDLPPRQIGTNEYFVLPDDRRLVTAGQNQWIIGREMIAGRVIINKWPTGWWFFRPTALLHAIPE